MEPEENTIVRFLGGLNPSFANTVQLQPYWTLQDVISLALKVEKQQRTGRQSATGFPARKCFKCQGFGHIASGCPNRRVVKLMEERDQEAQESFEPEVNDPDDGQPSTTIIPPDEGPLLVLRRLLNSHKEEPMQRHNIFRTRCTVDGRVCQLIIDSGSCENVASTVLIERLNLPTEDHPSPYKLAWIQKGSEVEVSKRCLVNFSIGKFEEQVWCDVVPMDACHLLLGRPWQYDRKSIHDGAANTYSLWHKDEQLHWFHWMVVLPNPEST
ncbi:hypothetical protein MA16_Dca011729 [Dendrobium catenatum]|uniref:CCHC-type domain-containing protein n=1 Tax=Dendrobium catenatum TaxID=906689 RepID=A0A2I0WY67_9ASPA|nr:hypothetical protein MA16_Dca011729 [Dendrobium catenatum]